MKDPTLVTKEEDRKGFCAGVNEHNDGGLLAVKITKIGVVEFLLSIKVFAIMYKTA
jgi:hypothetical protein